MRPRSISRYTQTSAGTLNVDLGAASCTSFDALSVSGNVSLAGTLNVTPGAGCTPTAAQTFDVVVSGGTASGNFATVPGYTTAVVGGNTLRLTKSP